MINGQITLQNFTAQAMEAKGKGTKIVDGKVTATEEEVPIKVIVLKDANSGLQINAIFSEKDFDQFVENLRGQTKIITAPSLVPLPKWLRRNGGIKS